MTTSKGHDGGSLSLSHLLSTLTITHHPETYIFATIPTDTFQPPHLPVPLASILLFFREPCTTDDQITLITTQATAEQYNLPYTYPCKMLTCNVHSSLEAVGFMAVLATKLAEQGVSTNTVGAYFHDHLFVPPEMAERAVKVLERVREEAEEEQGVSGGC